MHISNCIHINISNFHRFRLFYAAEGKLLILNIRDIVFKNKASFN